jgi:FkbM family methyltransferase
MSDEVPAIIVDTPQGSFYVDPRDQGVGAKLREYHQYSLLELETLCGLSREDSEVLLVGAHIGSLAVPWSRRVGHMEAIEANPDTFRLLEKNLQRNGCLNVVAHNVAASDTTAPIEFVLNTDNSGGSKRMPIVKDPLYFYDHPEVVQVKTAVLDELFPDRTFDVILLDIEGSEVFALRGMPRLLSRASYVVVEFVPHHLSHVAGIGIEEFLAPLQGYQTMVVQSLRKVVYADEFVPFLQSMLDAGQADAGIIFARARMAAVFQEY